MDKHIKMLLMKLSDKYKINLINTISYNPHRKAFSNKFKMRIVDIKTDAATTINNLKGKQGVISELVKWLE